MLCRGIGHGGGMRNRNCFVYRRSGVYCDKERLIRAACSAWTSVTGLGSDLWAVVRKILSVSGRSELSVGVP